MDQIPSDFELRPEALPVADGVNHRGRLVLAGVLVFISAGLLVYSQTMGFVWDEGFHLLTAQLIDAGKTPYVDFCFPQTPLNAYWNAFWLSLFHQNWRVTHVWAALAVAGATALTVDYVFKCFPIARWRLVCALIVAGFVGLNNVVVEFGTCAQAYGIGLFFAVAAFRATIAAAQRRAWYLAFAGGLFSGTAAACTLLTAPVVPVLLIWLWIYSEARTRLRRALAFAAGVVIPFIPVVALFIRAPRQVFFNIVQYQALFRREKWTGATPHDVDVLSAWLDSTPALFLGLLGLTGIVFMARKSGWERMRRAEFYLASALAVTLLLYIATAHPTFQRYFIFVVPFAAIVAAVGFYFVGSRLWSVDRPFWPTAMVMALLTLSIARALFDDRTSTTWKDYEKISAKVAEVTPKGASLYADELVYFILRRTPPFGMEFSYAHKLELPHDQQVLFHVISEGELNEQVKAGKYATVESCNDDRIDEMKLADLFPNKADVEDCSIFWGKVKPLPPDEKEDKKKSSDAVNKGSQ